MLDWAGEAQTFLRKSILQPVNELTAEDCLEHLQGQEKSLRAAYPALAARCESTRRNDTMDVGVKSQVLSPRMQDGEEANLRAKVLRVSRDFEESLGHRSKQEVVEFDFVLPDKIAQFVRQAEHHMEVGSGQEFSLSS